MIERNDYFINSFVFTDESSFNFYNDDGEYYSKRKSNDRYSPKNIRKTVKHGGGNIMIWGSNVIIRI